MSIYIDTSVLTAFYCRETGSAKAEKVLRSGKPLMLSNLVKLEMASAVSKKVRTGEFDDAFARNVLSLFHSHIRDNYFEFVAVENADVELADEWVSSLSTSLRTLDAMHLAMAFNRDAELLTADRILAESARRLKVSCHKL